jgi:hypothetical protein
MWHRPQSVLVLEKLVHRLESVPLASSLNEITGRW